MRYKNILILMMFSLLVGGCGAKVSMEDIADAKLVCDKAGLEARAIYAGTLEGTQVVCSDRNTYNISLSIQKYNLNKKYDK